MVHGPGIHILYMSRYFLILREEKYRGLTITNVGLFLCFVVAFETFSNKKAVSSEFI